MGHPRRRWNRATTTSHVAVAVEHVQHGYLLSINGFAAVVTFEGVVRAERRRKRRQPRSSAKARTRGSGAFATIAKLSCCDTCSAAPSSWSRSAVHEGHGCSTSGRWARRFG